GRTGFADAAGRRIALDEVDVDRWDLVDAQHPVVMEVRLLHATFLQRDFPVERRGEPEDMATLQLRDDGVRVHCYPGVDGGRHATQPHLAVLLHLTLHDGGHESAKGGLRADPASAARRQGRAPAGFFSHEIERRLKTRSLIEMSAPKVDRISSSFAC